MRWVVGSAGSLTTHNPKLLPYLHQCDAISPAASHGEIAIGCCHHVPHDAAAGGDCPGLELLRFGIETHERIWSHRGFAVPDDIVERHDAVRLRLRSARRGILLDRARLGIEPAKIT